MRFQVNKKDLKVSATSFFLSLNSIGFTNNKSIQKISYNKLVPLIT